MYSSHLENVTGTCEQYRNGDKEVTIGNTIHRSMMEYPSKCGGGSVLKNRWGSEAKA